VWSGLGALARLRLGREFDAHLAVLAQYVSRFSGNWAMLLSHHARQTGPGVEETPVERLMGVGEGTVAAAVSSALFSKAAAASSFSAASSRSFCASSFCALASSAASRAS
jgi:hypothetical protein